MPRSHRRSRYEIKRLTSRGGCGEVSGPDWLFLFGVRAPSSHLKTGPEAVQSSDCICGPKPDTLLRQLILKWIGEPIRPARIMQLLQRNVNYSPLFNLDRRSISLVGLQSCIDHAVSCHVLLGVHVASWGRCSYNGSDHRQGCYHHRRWCCRRLYGYTTSEHGTVVCRHREEALLRWAHRDLHYPRH